MGPTMFSGSEPRLAPAAQRVLSHLRQRVMRGELGAGEKLPSMRSLSRRFGVTLRTVQAAVRHLEEAGLVQSIHGSGVYVRAGSASLSQASATSDTVYVFHLKPLVLQEMMASELTKRLQQARLTPIPAQVYGQGFDSVAHLLEGWQERPPRAVVLVGGNPDFMRQLEEVLPPGVRVVAAYTYLCGPGQAWHYVNPDERLGYYQAVEHLIRTGHRAIGMLTHRRLDTPLHGRHNYRLANSHILGAVDALRASATPARLLAHYMSIKFADQFAPAYAPVVQQEVGQIAAWLSGPKRPQAVISHSWRMRFLRMACQRLGLRLGRDITLLGVGDPTPAYHGEFDCIAERYDLVVSTVVEMLRHQEADAGPVRHVLIPPRFVAARDFREDTRVVAGEPVHSAGLVG